MKDTKLLKYVPKKFHPYITDIYRDGDGIWVEGDKHLWNTLYDYHGIHCDTVAELREEIKGLIILADDDPRCHD